MYPNTTSPSPITVIIADNHTIFRTGLTAMLNEHPAVHIVAETTNGEDLLHKVEHYKPHIVITDIKMPRVNGIEATRRIRKRFPTTEVIALTSVEEVYVVLEMMEAGAKSYLVKTIRKEELFKAIHAAYHKQEYYCTTISGHMMRLMSRTHLHPYKIGNSALFSAREIEIIRMTCQEYSTKEIADQFHVTSHSIDTARERIRVKIGCKNMIGVTMYAVRNGIFCLEKELNEWSSTPENSN